MQRVENQSAAESKRTLRGEARRRLASVEPDQASRWSARVCERVLDLPEVANAKGGVLTCLSFGSEIDTWGIVNRLLGVGRPVYVPRAEQRDLQLHVHPFPCELQTLSIGLKQPTREAPEVPLRAIDQVIDVVLVVGLAFDRDGYRLGYGSGYFDRFLADRTLPTIGLAYGFQLLDEIPREAHDIPMSAIVTEQGTFRPSPFSKRVS